MIRTPFVLLFPGLFLVQVAVQTDTFETKFLRLIADRVDTATATRTAKLAQVGLPIREAYSLAYQGINPEAMASLRKSGLDLQAALNNWPPQLNDGVVLADCIVIGKVESIKYVADALYNKYYYVRVEQWIKGMPTKNNLVIVRTKGGGSSPIPGVSITVSHEVVFEKGEKLLLIFPPKTGQGVSDECESVVQLPPVFCTRGLSAGVADCTIPRCTRKSLFSLLHGFRIVPNTSFPF